MGGIGIYWLTITLVYFEKTNQKFGKDKNYTNIWYYKKEIKKK
jgi:hypothetical protein